MMVETPFPTVNISSCSAFPRLIITLLDVYFPGRQEKYFCWRAQAYVRTCTGETAALTDLNVFANKRAKRKEIGLSDPY
jgi:hypothetical protein